MWSSIDKRQELKSELQWGAKECYDRGLYQSAQWANEQARGIACAVKCPFKATPHDDLFQEEYDQYMGAMIAYQSKEYHRAQRLLEGTNSSTCRFLRAYCTYLEGERVMEEEAVDIQGSTQLEQTNKALRTLKIEMNDWMNHRPLDGFEWWLHAMVHKEMGLRDIAKMSLVRAVKAFPLHLAAWIDLAGLVESLDEVESMDLPDHFMKQFFLAFLEQELYQCQDAIARYMELLEVFPDSDYCLTQIATIYYNLRDFDPAQELFERLRKKDPLRLDGLDLYSNILYVKRLKPELSFLAHAAFEIDKYRPETCCIVGNFYSLRQDHKKALVYFQRALQLDRRNLGAWILIGHEYLELKNTPDAIEAYRRAADINPREYRAWYGLGQAYEILHMYTFAVYHYNTACILRPTDGRMWAALGKAYKSLGRLTDATHCYERSEQDASQKGEALYELAQLYSDQNERAKAADCYLDFLDYCVEQEIDDNQDMVKAYLSLARYYKDIDRLDESEAFAAKVCQYSGREREEAKAILLDIRMNKHLRP